MAARDEGLTEEQAGAVAVVGTEIATNVLKHANGGEIHISRLSPHDRPGVELLSIDRGPGVHNLQQCFVDGYTTSNTPGTGLGAVSRMSHEMDAYTQPGKGFVLVSRIFASSADRALKRWRIGAVVVPFKGEEACGDAWTVHCNAVGLKLLLADGLGHGVFAADAALAATAAFHRVPTAAPSAVLETVHRALRGTRGAAVAVASVENDGKLRYAGLGNISGVILGGAKAQYLLSHNGTAGHTASRFQEFEYTIQPVSLVIMHSDGLITSWSLDAYPGLANRHPSVIAGVLYRDASRGRDDICVVVAKGVG